MPGLQLWMRVVGGLYLLMCLAALARVPIRAEGPAGVLDRAAAGDATARFLVNTWVTLGLALGVIGAALVYFSRTPADARVLAWTVIALELAWGIPVDVFKIARGQRKVPSIIWIGIHAVVAATGLGALGAW
jgi:hypothetical protein